MAELEHLAEEIEREAQASRWCPKAPYPKQAEFLALTEFEAFYGGAAGGGKSEALLMEALKDVDVPGYAALILRRTYRDLALPGALMDRAAEWLQPTAARWNDTDKQWRFPSGAILQFGYLDSPRDIYRYQSAEFQCICFDELTQFKLSQYTYLISRCRGPEDVPVRWRMRSAGNPGDIGHDWVKARFVEPGDPSRPFIPAYARDNPSLPAAYGDNLDLLDPTTRDQLKLGLWIKDTTGLVYPIDQSNKIPRLPEIPHLSYVLGVDLGASQNKPSTAFVVTAYSDRLPGVWVVQSEAFAGLTPSDIAEHIIKLRGRFSFQRIVIDEGALGKGYGEEFRRRHRIACQPAQKRQKLGFRKELRGAIARGELLIVEGSNLALIDELETLPWNADGTDNDPAFDNHLSDALLYGWRECRAYAHTLPESKPTPGTREWAEAEAERMIQEKIREARRRRHTKWWRRGV